MVDGDGGDDELFGGPADVVRSGDGNYGLIGNFGGDVLLGGNGDDLFLGDNPMGPADPSHDVGKGRQCSDFAVEGHLRAGEPNRGDGASGAPSSVPDHEPLFLVRRRE